MGLATMGFDNPVTLLKNDHSVLAGQLELLRQPERFDAVAVLTALARDCTLHFQREQRLFDALRPALGGGRSLDSLVAEHEELENKIRNLLERGPRSANGTRYRTAVQELIEQFQAHMRHEETVVYVLAGTRLSEEARQALVHTMLTV